MIGPISSRTFTGRKRPLGTNPSGSHRGKRKRLFHCFLESEVLTHNPDDLKDRTHESRVRTHEIKDSHKYAGLRDCRVNEERIVGLEDGLKKS